MFDEIERIGFWYDNKFEGTKIKLTEEELENFESEKTEVIENIK